MTTSAAGADALDVALDPAYVPELSALADGTNDEDPEDATDAE